MNFLTRFFRSIFDRRKNQPGEPEIGRRMADVHEMRRHALRDQAIGSQTGRLPAQMIRPSFSDPQAKRQDPATGLTRADAALITLFSASAASDSDGGDD